VILSDTKNQMCNWDCACECSQLDTPGIATQKRRVWSDELGSYWTSLAKESDFHPFSFILCFICVSGGIYYKAAKFENHNITLWMYCIYVCNKWTSNPVIYTKWDTVRLENMFIYCIHLFTVQGATRELQEWV
jgi:hypothetical protein